MYHTIPYYMRPDHNTSDHTILHTILHYTILYHTIPYHTIPYHTVPYHTTSYILDHTIHATPNQTELYHTTSHLYYMCDFCLGPNCRHRHVRRVLCVNYLCGFCPEGKECKYMQLQQAFYLFLNVFVLVW